MRRGSFDLVHAHYGLAGWCASLAGARPLIVTFHGTDVRHPTVGRLSRRLARRLDLVAGASRALFAPEAERPGLPKRPGASAVLPCGADLDRFRPSPRAEARQRLGLDPEGRYLLFPAATFRPEKRHDRALEVARLAGAELLTGGAIEAERMPDWVNAANAVLVTSENEGFGLVAVEALACDVPVLSTPVGVAPALLARRRRLSCRALRLPPMGGARPRSPRGARSARRRAPAGPLVLGRADGRAGPGRLSRGSRLAG